MACGSYTGRLRVEINLDGSLEVGGVFVDPLMICQMEELS